MGNRMKKWLAALLAACLLCAMVPSAVMEADEVLTAPVEETPAEDALSFEAAEAIEETEEPEEPEQIEAIEEAEEIDEELAGENASLPAVKSVKASKKTINAGGKVKFTVKTAVAAKFLHLISGTKTLKTWKAAGNSKVSGKTRVWTVTYKIANSGKVKYTFKASLNKKKLGKGKSVTITVRSNVTSAAVGSATIQAGKTAKYIVKTDPGAKYLTMYSSAGKKLKTWKRSGNATLSSDKKSLVWRVNYKYARGGNYTVKFKASTDKKHFGLAKSAKLKVLPKVTSVKASPTKLVKGKAATLTVKTDAAAKYLFLYIGGEKVKGWKAAGNSKVSGQTRIWTVKYKRSAVGKTKLTFKSAMADKKTGIGKSVVVTWTEKPPKYRALLIGEESFSPRCTRNSGDVKLMKSMLKSIKGPTGASYSVTTKYDLSRDQVLSAIKKTFAGATENDVSLFFIATHGDVSCSYSYYPQYAGCLSMIPETGYYEDQLRLDDLATALRAVPGKVIVILESCGSGAAVYSRTDSENSLRMVQDIAAFDQAAVEAFENADPGLLVDKDGNVVDKDSVDVAKIGDFRVENKFYVLTASRYQETSYGTEASPACNYFTKWLTEGIGTSGHMKADTDYSGVTTLNELFKYISKVGDNYAFRYYDEYYRVQTGYQHVQVYPKNSSYKLFKR